MVQDVYLNAPNGEVLFQLDFGMPGLLLAEVSGLAPSTAVPRIDLINDSCELLGELPSSPGRLIAVPAPGRLFLRVRAGSHLDGGWYRLLTGFAETRPSTGSETWPDKVDEWDEDDDGDGVTAPPPSKSSGVPVALCDRLQSDDHGDSILCASELVIGSPIRAEIGQAPATDVDYFTFTLKAHAFVAVESRGDTDTYGQLLDAGGRRLAADDDSGSGTNFRVAGKLCPGRYVVRVEGSAGAEGPYVLTARLK